MRRHSRSGARANNPGCLTRARAERQRVVEPLNADALREQLAVVRRVAEEDLGALRALEVEVRGVLPGHPDAPVELDRLLGGVDGQVEVILKDLVTYVGSSDQALIKIKGFLAPSLAAAIDSTAPATHASTTRVE